MKTGFIGAGKVGSSFGAYLYSKGVTISGYYSRTAQNAQNAQEAAESTDSKSYESLEELVRASDIVFVTTGDDAIRAVINEVNSVDGAEVIAAHMSGALSTAECEGKCLSLHPLVAVSDAKSPEVFGDCVFSLEGDDRQAMKAVGDMMRAIGNTVVEIEPHDKKKYHAAAVFASNLVVGLYARACELLTECGFDEETANEALGSLFLKNAGSIIEKGPTAALTGPVERADASTIQGHLDVLDGDSEEIYKALSKDVLEVAKKKNPNRDYSKIEEMLQ